MARALVLALRPKQWTKNLLVFFALFFTVGEEWKLGDLDAVVTQVSKSATAFVLFCAITGAVYLVNDLLDVERDRAHPTKRGRPIASSALPVTVAWIAAALLAAPALALSFLFEPLFGGVVLGYLALMLAYSYALKNMVLLDVFSISAGFILRAVAGAAALHVPISPWLYTCTGLGALLIALGKRRSELAQAGDSAGGQRDTLERYTVSLLDQLIAVVAPSTLLAYTLYTFTAPNVPEDHTMMLTIPFVVYGLFRYMYLVHNTDMGERPEEILITDVPLMVSIVLWLASAATVLVVFR
jgi:4-hydroxybenzoate polyprenyltransferase